MRLTSISPWGVGGTNFLVWYLPIVYMIKALKFTSCVWRLKSTIIHLCWRLPLNCMIKVLVVAGSWCALVRAQQATGAGRALVRAQQAAGSRQHAGGGARRGHEPWWGRQAPRRGQFGLWLLSKRRQARVRGARRQFVHIYPCFCFLQPRERKNVGFWKGVSPIWRLGFKGVSLGLILGLGTLSNTL
jgi:hypothetical protein